MFNFVFYGCLKFCKEGKMLCMGRLAMGVSHVVASVVVLRITVQREKWLSQGAHLDTRGDPEAIQIIIP